MRVHGLSPGVMRKTKSILTHVGDFLWEIQECDSQIRYLWTALTPVSSIHTKQCCPLASSQKVLGPVTLSGNSVETNSDTRAVHSRPQVTLIALNNTHSGSHRLHKG